MEQYVGQATEQSRVSMTVLALFGALGLVLSSLGIYGVLSFLVGRRTREIGIRMALGAQRTDVLRLILWRGLLLTMVGLVIGLSVAFASTRFLETQLYEVKIYDPFTYLSVGLLLLVVSLLASYLPARRAAKVDPLEALRYE